MDLDRGTLAKIDRKIFSAFGHDESWQMVRVPVSEAVWSAWKRYCDALGISMGRAIVALVENELQSVVGELGALPLFLAEFENGLAERQRALDGRERELKAQQRSLRENERRIYFPPPSPRTTTTAKVGRNDPCPCGSGTKYKHCHGP